MKKITFILMLSLFAFIACQTDNVNTETETFELKSYGTTINPGAFNAIPAKFAANPDAYVQSLLSTIAKGDGVRYGCVTFIDGFAIIDDDCSITSGVPRDFRDCDLVGVRYLACAPNFYNQDCIICAVAYIIECDGRLGWVLGYNIICDISPQPF
ncbi:hypothetical protein H2O64_11535 [Kordia sp. YSTF-M3]|uniref:Lipoprotein n=1 Tax=Kordia aestuariivivens TaxID=2759037 RepID=A0ABR7Q9R8_9FLAO|nr:hypothetical protein [Kordia aestuariivivens]MBC8755310.1 hypothetical protein [Kordia aestuariivivens]